jgi:hypothetical protein
VNTEDFDRLVQETVHETADLLMSKGAEYAGNHADRLANFKRGSARVGVHPLQVLWIYAAKHIDSIETYIRTVSAGGQPKLSEPIEGRFNDLINYCLLAKGIVADLGLPRGPVSGPIAPMVADRDGGFDSGGVRGQLDADSVGSAAPVAERPSDPQPGRGDDRLVYRSKPHSWVLPEEVLQRTSHVGGEVDVPRRP